MPSPGRIAILTGSSPSNTMRVGGASRGMPFVAALKSVDVGKAFERVAELVDALREAGFRERVDLERVGRTFGQPDLLLDEIDEDRRAGVCFKPRDLGRDDLLR